MFIVVEGLDGTGKSTISKALASAIGAVHLSTPQKSLSNARKIIDDEYEYNSHARQLFYASTVVNISQQIERLISQGKSVVVDRYWLSTQVYHNWKCNGGSFMLLEIEKYILAPDITIYLELPLDARSKRINQRHDNTKEDSLTLIENSDTELNKLYNSYQSKAITGKWLAIDATQSIEYIVQDILTTINIQ